MEFPLTIILRRWRKRDDEILALLKKEGQAACGDGSRGQGDIMLRDITLGQYYPVDSVLHRMDPRTKLFGTMVFIISLFVADSIWAYLVATLFLAMAIRLSQNHVRLSSWCGDLRPSSSCCLISVSFNLFLTPG